MRLLLFDIDGTLVDTRGAGLAALLDAVEQVFEVDRESIPALDLAGATDGGVMRTLFGHLGIPDDLAIRARFIEAYLKRLEHRLNAAYFEGVTLPGVLELVQALSGEEQVMMGLLTGNVRGGAEQKLRRFNLHSFFVDGSFGDDADDRNLLGPVAVKRFEERCGRGIMPAEVIVIGDTPRDVACAAAFGARCLAVATGVHGRTGLDGSGAWMCLDDLRDTRQVVELLMSK
jgi:phosphoglycolate phosphatase